jgi:O-methyltransferase
LENRFQRELARTLVGGREDFLVRLALASRFAALFKDNPNIPKFDKRSDLYAHVAEMVIKGEAFDYLEFGVFQGDSIRAVSSQNPNPACRFWGFDSFEGLPENWNDANPAGTFNLGGRTPQIDDQRVKFVRGWFNQTLPGFLATYQPAPRLWIHVDADLYSSGMYALSQLDRYIGEGTVLVFDEFEDLMHEFKVFCDYTAMSGKGFGMIAATSQCRQTAFVCQGAG